jgi:hypothetical protein
MYKTGPFDTSKKFHIPGYRGYVPKIKPENIYGKTYSSITKRILNENQENQEDGINLNFVNITTSLKFYEVRI